MLEDTQDLAQVLVVDDDPDRLRLTSKLLAQAGHEILTASTGEEALARARAERPELVVLDVALPGVNGLEVWRRLRADPDTTDVSVILVPGLKTDSDSQA